jgi:NADPH-dependent curcumin reductase CurA
VSDLTIDHRTPQGLSDVGQLKAGETLVVSGAAGATGSIVCQLGKIIGAKVIAIAGTDDKCKWLEDELGVDKALNYKNHNFVNDFKESVGYLDVYFDNGRRLLYSLVCILSTSFAQSVVRSSTYA